MDQVSRMQRHIKNLKDSGGKRITIALRPDTVKALDRLSQSRYGADATQIINKAIQEIAEQQQGNYVK